MADVIYDLWRKYGWEVLPQLLPPHYDMSPTHTARSKGHHPTENTLGALRRHLVN